MWPFQSGEKGQTSVFSGGKVGLFEHFDGVSFKGIFLGKLAGQILIFSPILFLQRLLTKINAVGIPDMCSTYIYFEF